MATEYSLTYFDVPDFGDIPNWPLVCRQIYKLMMFYKGATSKETRIPFIGPGSPIPADIKERLPYGQVPILQVNGKVLAQSGSIYRYLAQELKLAGSNTFEAAKADEIVESCKDMAGLFTSHFRETDLTKKAEGLKEAVRQAQEKYLSRFNAYSQENGGHLVGDSLTWADLAVTCFVVMYQKALVSPLNLLEALPVLREMVKNVLEDPKIVEWVTTRTGSDSPFAVFKL